MSRLLLIFSIIILVLGYAITSDTDVSLYKCYANNFLHGSGFFTSSPDVLDYSRCLPKIMLSDGSFGRLPAEYPAFSLIPMLLSAIGGDALYHYIFISLMVVVIVGIYLFLFYIHSKESALSYIVYIVIGGFGTAVGRFDIIVGALILFSLYEATKKHYYKSYILLAIATMFKLVPVILLLPLFLDEQAGIKRKSVKRFYGILTFLLICSITFAISLAIDNQGALFPFIWAINRPVQIESVPASILTLLSSVKIINICTSFEFGSLNIYGFLAEKCGALNYNLYNMIIKIITIISTGLLILSSIYLSRLLILRKIAISHFYLTILLVFLVTNKVFSPQYLFWVYPLIAFIYRFDKRWFIITALIAFLTTLIYPFLYQGLFPFYNPALLFSAILIRNLVIVFLTVFYVFNIFNIRCRKKI